MNAPRLLCASCGKETTPTKPVCDACMIAVGETPTPFCALCESALFPGNGIQPAEHGIRKTKAGGYAGKCAVVFAVLEKVQP